MLWSELSKYFNRDDDSETMEETGFISHYPKEKFIIEVEDEYGEMLISDYMQICRDEKTGKDELIFQVIVDSENPINIPIKTTADHTNITVNIYKRILKNVD